MQLRAQHIAETKYVHAPNCFVPLDRASGGVPQHSILSSNPPMHPGGYRPDVLMSVSLSRFATALHSEYGDVEPLWVGLCCYGYHHAEQRLQRLCETFYSSYYTALWRPSVDVDDDVFDSRKEPRSCLLHIPHGVYYSPDWSIFLLLKIYRLATGDDGQSVDELYCQGSFKRASTKPEVEQLRKRVASVAPSMWVSRTELGWNVVSLKPGGEFSCDKRTISIDMLCKPLSIDGDERENTWSTISDPAHCIRSFLHRRESYRGRTSPTGIDATERASSIPIDTELILDIVRPDAVCKVETPCQRRCEVDGKIHIACAGRMANSNYTSGVPAQQKRHELYVSLAGLSLHKAKTVKGADLRTFIVEVVLRRCDNMGEAGVVENCFLDKDGRGLVSKQYSAVSHHAHDCAFDDDLVIFLPPISTAGNERLHLLFTIYHISFKKSKKMNAFTKVLSRAKDDTTPAAPTLLVVGHTILQLFGEEGILNPSTEDLDGAPWPPPSDASGRTKTLKVLTTGNDYHNMIFSEHSLGYFQVFSHVPSNSEECASLFWDLGRSGLKVQAHTNTVYEHEFGASSSGLHRLHATVERCMQRNERLRMLMDVLNPTSKTAFTKDLHTEIKTIESMTEDIRHGVAHYSEAASTLDTQELLSNMCVWMDLSIALLCVLEESRIEQTGCNRLPDLEPLCRSTQFLSIEVGKALEAWLLLLQKGTEEAKCTPAVTTRRTSAGSPRADDVDRASPLAWYCGAVYANDLLSEELCKKEFKVWQHVLQSLQMHFKRKQKPCSSLSMVRVTRHLFQIVVRSLVLEFSAFCANKGLSSEPDEVGRSFAAFDKEVCCVDALAAFSEAIVSAAAANSPLEILADSWGVAVADLSTVMHHDTLHSIVVPFIQSEDLEEAPGLETARQRLAQCTGKCAVLGGFLNRLPNPMVYVKSIAVVLKDALDAYVSVVHAEEATRARQVPGSPTSGYSDESDFERYRVAAYSAAGVAGQLLALCTGCVEPCEEQVAHLRALFLPTFVALWRAYTVGAVREERYRMSAIVTHVAQVMKMKDYARKNTHESPKSRSLNSSKFRARAQENNPEVLASTIIAKQTHLADEREGLEKAQTRDRRALRLFGGTILTLVEGRREGVLTAHDLAAMRLFPSILEAQRTDEYWLLSLEARNCTSHARTGYPVVASIALLSCDTPIPFTPSECPASTLSMSVNTAWDATSAVGDNASAASPTLSQKVQWSALGGSGGRLGYVDDQYFAHAATSSRRASVSSSRRNSTPDQEDPQLGVCQRRISGHAACIALQSLSSAITLQEKEKAQDDASSTSNPDMLSVSFNAISVAEDGDLCATTLRCCEAVLASHAIHEDEYTVHLKEAALCLMLRTILDDGVNHIGSLVRNVCDMLGTCSLIYKQLAGGKGRAEEECTGGFACGFYFACLECSSAAEVLEALLCHYADNEDAMRSIAANLHRCIFVAIDGPIPSDQVTLPSALSPDHPSPTHEGAIYLQQLRHAIAMIATHENNPKAVHVLCEEVLQAITLRCEIFSVERCVHITEHLVRGLYHDVALEYLTRLLETVGGQGKEDVMMLRVLLSGCALLHARFCDAGATDSLMIKEVPWEEFPKVSPSLGFFAETAEKMEGSEPLKCALHTAVLGRVPVIADAGNAEMKKVC